MVDREKVIQKAERIMRSTVDRDMIDSFCEDVIALLKEQETTFEKDGHHICCLNCGEYWCDRDREGDPFPMNFCPNCGKKVKWENDK